MRMAVAATSVKEGAQIKTKLKASSKLSQLVLKLKCIRRIYCTYCMYVYEVYTTSYFRHLPLMSNNYVFYLIPKRMLFAMKTFQVIQIPTQDRKQPNYFSPSLLKMSLRLSAPGHGLR